MGTTTVETKLHAKAISGSDIYDVIGATKVTDEVVTVQNCWDPTQQYVSILRCVDLNYSPGETAQIIVMVWR